MEEIIELKNKLHAELSKENLDYSKILMLSNALAKLDENSVRFTIDAGVINRLGKELVGKRETAVSELIKNAYDADATKVSLIFQDAHNKGGTLIIEDNGEGMTRDQLINGFMRLSSTDKIHRPISEKYKRVKSGKKGIGRFATQRLGSKLTIVTQTIDSKDAVRIVIDWESFTQDSDLIYISSTIDPVPKEKDQGTTLVIEGLRDSWSDASIKRVYRITSEILQPFPLSNAVNSGNNDPGFATFYYRDTKNDENAVANDEIVVYNHAIAEIEGYIEDDGQGYWALSSKRLNYPQEVFLIGGDKSKRDDLQIKFTHIRNIHFKAYYFIWEGKLFSQGVMTLLRELAIEKGGIRLYRNGIRVLPYGEVTDDWLGLDKSNNRSKILGPHANMNFFGFVEVNDHSNFLLEETSSREGVVENEVYEELQDFVYRSITSAIVQVSHLRGRKATASQRGFTSQKKSATSDVDDLIGELQDITTTGTQQESSSEKPTERVELTNAIESLIEARGREKEEITTLINELNMLRVLAGLGLVIGEFIHEIQRYNMGFDAEIDFLRNNREVNDTYLERVNQISTNFKSYLSYTSYFDTTIQKNALRNLERIELRTVVRDFETTIQNELRRTRTIFTTNFIGYDLYTVPMHQSEWASILFNLYTNSKKAILRRHIVGKMHIECGKTDSFVYLEYSDNGDGIPECNKEKIFEAFFTTTSAAFYTANDADSLTGTGLGLKIVSDIIESYNGEIHVSTPKQGFATTIRINIPKGDIDND